MELFTLFIGLFMTKNLVDSAKQDNTLLVLLCVGVTFFAGFGLFLVYMASK